MGNSGELDMTVNILIQVDKLVQLIESPVFTCKLPMPRPGGPQPDALKISAYSC